jgi:AraC-like DNA-binding protein
VLAHQAISPEADLASLAVRFGYSDQAHLTRETSRLAGMTPSALANTLRPAGSSGHEAARRAPAGRAGGDASFNRQPVKPNPTSPAPANLTWCNPCDCARC